MATSRPLLGKILALSLVVFWAVPLYVADGRKWAGWQLSLDYPALWIVPLLLVAIVWASFAGKTGVRLGALLLLVAFVDGVATLSDGERLMFQPGMWLLLVVLVFALALALEDALRERWSAQVREALPITVVTLAVVALTPVYFSFQAQRKVRNPVYTALFGAPPLPAPVASTAPASTPSATVPPAVQAAAAPVATEERAPSSPDALAFTATLQCARGGRAESGWRRRVTGASLVDFDWLPAAKRVSVVTQDGLLYSSANEGVSWRQADCGSSYLFHAAQFVTGETGWAVGALGPWPGGAPALAATTDGGATWTVRAIDDSGPRRPGPLRGIRFWDESAGVLIGNYEAFVTADGGESWRATGPEPLRGTITAVDFGANRAIWLYEDGDGGVLHRSLDGGASWQSTAGATRQVRLLNGDTVSLPALSFVDFYGADFGVAVSNANRLYATRDGGAQWFEIAPGGHSAPRGYTVAARVDGERSATVVEPGPDGGTYSTDDAARTWTKLAEPVAAAPNCRARAIAGQRAWRIACNGALERASDDGRTWTTVGPFDAAPLRAIHFVDAAHGWAAGEDGTVLGTHDGGVTWTHIDAPTDENLIAARLVDSGAFGWALGERGTVLRFAADERRWTVQRAGAPSEQWRDLFALDARHAWAVGERGTLLATHDGEQWQARSTLFDETLCAVWFVDADDGWAVGERGIVLHTRDGGVSWSDQPLPTGKTLTALQFRDRDHGWVAGADERLFRTDDGGASWAPVAAPAPPPFRALRFFDERRGLLAATDGWYRTADGGASWQRIDALALPYGNAALDNAWFVDPDSGWAAGGGEIMHYHAGPEEPDR